MSSECKTHQYSLKAVNEGIGRQGPNCTRNMDFILSVERNHFMIKVYIYEPGDLEDNVFGFCWCIEF